MTGDFIEEILAEAEQVELQQRAGYYDLVLAEIRDIEQQITAIHEQAECEVALIKDWELRRCLQFQERIAFMARKLEAFIRETGQKTMDLPHGVLKIRKAPDKVEIADLAVFLQHARSELLSIVPENIKPDLPRIKEYIKRTGEIPDGVQFIQGSDAFTYKLRSPHGNGSTEA
jgi:hypothetical protein